MVPREPHEKVPTRCIWEEGGMMKSSFRIGRTILLASMSTLAFSAAASAQTAPAAPAGEATAPAAEAAISADTAAPAGGLEEIVVTARKRDETLQNIPVAITAFSPAQIQRYDISSIDRIAAATPNLTVGRATTGSGAQISLRGIGTPASALGIESSTAVIVDGAYYGNGRILNEGFFDLGRIQVLKGPQALFFGKNATAGVIAIDSANPGDKFEGSTKVGYEFRAKQAYVEQIISAPLSETLGVRLAVRASKMFGGYSTNLATPVTFTVNDVINPANPLQTFTAPAADGNSPREREIVGRLTLQWKPIDGLVDTFKVSGTLDKTNDGAWNNLIYSCFTGFSTLQPTVPCKRSWTYYHNEMPQPIAANFPDAFRSGRLGTEYHSYALTNNLEYKLGKLTFSSNTNYQNQFNHWLTDSDYQERVTQIYVGSHERWKAFSEEARITTNLDLPINAMVGVLYQKSKLLANQTVYSGNSRTSTASAENQYVAFSKISTTDGETLSPFIQVVWKIIPQIELAGGVRYTHETKDSFFVHPFVRPGQIYRIGQPITDSQVFNQWTPEVTLSYRPTNYLNIYGGFKTGYKSGGFSNESSYTNFSIPADLDFEPETAKGFEGGVKVTTLANQLRLGLAAFTYQYKNLQVDFFEAQTFRFITTNAGSARTKGVEFNFDFAPRAIAGLNLHGALNYDKAYYVNFIAPCVTGQTPAGGCLTTATSPYGGLFVQDLSGHPTANAPRWTGALGGSYEVPVGGDLTFAISGDARYSSSYNASPFNNPLAFQPKYVNLDASVVLRSQGRWEAALIARNLTNQFVVSGSLDAPSTGSGTGTAAGKLGDQRGYANTPRTVQLQFTLHY